jgi:2-acylglycerol O-acyltransferase 2
MLLAYYIYRAIYPLKKWPRIKELFNMDEWPYCNSQKIVFEEGAMAPEPKSKTLLAVSPHGILTIGFISCSTSQVFAKSDIKWLVADALLVLPFVRDFMVWNDSFEASKQRMTQLCNEGENIGLIPGGFQEATIYMRNRHRLYIKERKGFIKYALQYGYKIMPGYVFGEERGYWQLHTGIFDMNFWLNLNKYSIPTIAAIGKFGLLPDHNIDVCIVFGKSMQLPLIPKPSEEDINKYHQEYIAQITGLFERNKEKYAFDGKNAVLEQF